MEGVRKTLASLVDRDKSEDTVEVASGVGCLMVTHIVTDVKYKRD